MQSVSVPRLLALVVLAGLLRRSSPQPGACTVTIFAGSPSSIPGRTDATGTAARLDLPTGLCLAASGDLLVAESGGMLLRRVSPAAQVVTLAGAYLSAGSADGAWPTARLNAPTGLAQDPQTNITYIADSGGHAIRAYHTALNATSLGSVNSTVGTLAGTPGAPGFAEGAGPGASRFSAPYSLAVLPPPGGAGGPSTLAVADTGNNCIRGVHLGNGSTFTLAGSRAAGWLDAWGQPLASQYFAPRGVASDGRGGVLIADTANHRVRMVSAGGAAVATLAGGTFPGWADGVGSAAAFNFPYALLLHPGTNCIYVSDHGSARLRVIAADWATVGTLLGNGVKAHLDGTGNLARLYGATAMALDASGSALYLADSAAQSIRRVTCASPSASPPPSASPSPGAPPSPPPSPPPSASASATPTPSASPPPPPSPSPTPSPAGCTLTTLAGLPGVPGSADGVGAAARLARPAALALNASAGVLLVADALALRVRALALASGALTTLAGSGVSGALDSPVGTAAQFAQPAGLACCDAAGAAYVADALNHKVRVIDARGGVGTLAGSPAGAPGSADGAGSAAAFSAPSSCALAAEGGGGSGLAVLYVADSGTGRIRRVTLLGALVSTLAGEGVGGGGGSGALLAPRALLAAPRGEGVFFADGSGGGAVRFARADGLVWTLAGGGGGGGGVNGRGSAAGFSAVAALAHDGRGGLVAAEAGQFLLRSVTPGGATGTLAGNGSAGSGSGFTAAQGTALAGPTALAAGGSGGSGGAPYYIGDGTTIRVYSCSAGVQGGGEATPLPTPSPSPSPALPASAQCVLRTVAGGAPGALASTDGVGLGAAFQQPAALALAPAGDALLVSDVRNHSLRRLQLASGSVTTLAGGRAGGCAHANGVGAAAAFCRPAGLAFNGSGWLLVADSGNNRIRAASPEGVVEDYAGNGSACSANAALPGSACFAAPGGVAADTGSGAVYVADTGGNRVRVIASPAGPVLTLAGTGAAGGSDAPAGTAATFAAPLGLALAAGARLLYVSESGGGRIRCVALAGGGSVSTVAGSSAGVSGFADGAGARALFSSPAHLALSASGLLLYVADAGGNVVRAVALSGGSGSGSVSTVAGVGGAPGSSGSRDGAVSGVGGGARCAAPSGLALDPNGGTLYIAEGNSSSVRVLRCAGGGAGAAEPSGSPSPSPTPSAGAPPPSASPTATPTPPASACTVRTVAGNPAVQSANGVGLAASLYQPMGMCIMAPGSALAGHVYIADAFNSAVKVLAPNSSVSTLVGGLGSGWVDGAASAAKVNVPYSVACDPSPASAYIVLADSSNHRLRLISTSTGATSTLAGSTFGYADGVGSSAQFHTPYALVVRPSGAVAVADTLNHRIRSVTPGGVVTTIAGPPPGSTPNGIADGFGTAVLFSYPAGITVDAWDTLYVSHRGNSGHIRAIRPDGLVTTLAGVASFVQGCCWVDGVGSVARFNSPLGLSMDASGLALLVADSGNGAIRRVDTVTGAVTTLAGSAFPASSATGLPASSISSLSYVDGALAGATFNSPTAVLVAGDGSSLLVSDTRSYVIRAIACALPSPSPTGSPGASPSATPRPTPSATPSRTPSATPSPSPLPLHLQQRACTVALLAGSPLGAPGALDGVGTAARFTAPTALALRGSGSAGILYVAGNATLRAVALGSGSVTALAGSSASAGHADAPTGAGALFSQQPAALALDAAGAVLYVADGNRVRTVATASGATATIAGSALAAWADAGAGSAAAFRAPSGLCLSASGAALYVGDTGNSRLRVLTLASTAVATLAGNGTPGSSDGGAGVGLLSAPRGLACSGDTVFVADGGSLRVRAVSMSTGALSTLAGSGYAAYADSAGGSGRGAGASFLAPSALAAGVVVGAGSWLGLLLNGPGALPGGAGAGVPAQLLLLTDAHTLRAVDAGGSGAVLTVAGSGSAALAQGPARAAAFSGARGLAVDAGAGAVYLADTGTHTLRVVSCGGVASASPSPSPGSSASPSASASASATRAPPPPPSPSPSSLPNTCVLALWSGGGAATHGDNTIGASASFANPSGIAVNGSGWAVVSTTLDFRVRLVAPGGGTATIAGSGSPSHADGVGYAASFVRPAGLVWAGPAQGGAIFLCDSGGHTIRRLSPPAAFAGMASYAPSAVVTIAGVPAVAGWADGQGTGGALFSGPTGCALDASGGGLLYVCDRHNGVLRTLSLASGLVSTLAGRPGVVGVAVDAPSAADSLWVGPTDCALDPGTGWLYVSDGHAIRAVAPGAARAVVTLAGSAAVSGFSNGGGPGALFFSPRGLAADGLGHLFCADSRNNRVRLLVGLPGSGVDVPTVSTLCGTGAGPGGSQLGNCSAGAGIASIFTPIGLSLNATGALTVTDSQGNYIRRLLSCGLGVAGPPSASASPSPSTGASPSPSTTPAATPSSSPAPCQLLLFAGALPPANPSSLDGTAGAASFNNPAGLQLFNGSAAPGQPLLVVADAGGHRVRLVTALAAVTTIAGTGSAGYMDASVGISGKLSSPQDACTDQKTGNIYVADTNNHRIRVVSPLPPYAVTTLAGSGATSPVVNLPGAAASFFSPRGIGCGSTFAVVVDFSNALLRKVTYSGGVVSTLAGTAGAPGFLDGPALLSRVNPMGVALDARDNVWIADAFNNRVRLLSAATGAVSTVAGSGQSASMDGPGTAAAFYSPNRLFVSASGSAVWVGDTSNHRLRVIDVASGGVSTLAGSGAAAFAGGAPAAAAMNLPRGIAVADNGVVYAADTANDVLRALVCGGGGGAAGAQTPSPTPTPTSAPLPLPPPRVCSVGTLAGWHNVSGAVDGVSGLFSAPTGLALSASGALLYVSDAGSHRLRAVSTASGAVETIAGGGSAGWLDAVGVAARFNAPWGLLLLPGGLLVVADSANHRLRAVALGNAAVSTLAGSGVAGWADGPPLAALFSGPAALAGSSAAAVYVAEGSGARVRLVTPALVTTLAGSGARASLDGVGGGAAFSQPVGLAQDPVSGLLLLADGGTTAKLRIVSTGGGGGGAAAAGREQVTTVAGLAPGALRNGVGSSARLAAPGMLAFDAAGGAYVADAHAVRYAPGPWAAAAAAASAALATLSGGGSAGYADAPPAPSPLFSSPRGIAVAPDGRTVWVTDSGNAVIRVLTCDGAAPLPSPLPLPSPPPPSATPGCVLSTVSGMLLNAGAANGAALSATFNAPIACALDASRTQLYIADQFNSRIRRLDLAQGLVSNVAGTGSNLPPGLDGDASSATLWSPTAVVVDASGSVFVADTGNSKIRGVTPGGRVYTLAGSIAGCCADGPGLGARLAGPTALALDSAQGGLLYVSDTNNHRVRVLALASGTLSTLAGSGSSLWVDGLGTAAAFIRPAGLALDDASGVLYVSDAGNYRVRAVQCASGLVTTLSGSGVVGYADGVGTAASFGVLAGLAFLPAQGMLVVADTGSFALRSVSNASGATATLFGPGAAVGAQDGPLGVGVLGALRGVAVAASAAGDGGSVTYLADTSNQLIRTVTCPRPSASATASVTPSQSTTAGFTGSATGSATATTSTSATPTASASAPPTPTPSSSPMQSASGSAPSSTSPTASGAAPLSLSPTPSPTPSVTAPLSLTPTASPSPSPTPSPSPSPSPTPSPSPLPSPSPTVGASGSATAPASLCTSATASACATVSPSPSPSPTVTQGASPSASPSALLALTPTGSRTTTLEVSASISGNVSAPAASALVSATVAVSAAPGNTTATTSPSAAPATTNFTAAASLVASAPGTATAALPSAASPSANSTALPASFAASASGNATAASPSAAPATGTSPQMASPTGPAASAASANATAAASLAPAASGSVSAAASARPSATNASAALPSGRNASAAASAGAISSLQVTLDSSANASAAAVTSPGASATGRGNNSSAGASPSRASPSAAPAASSASFCATATGSAGAAQSVLASVAGGSGSGGASATGAPGASQSAGASAVTGAGAQSDSNTPTASLTSGASASVSSSSTVSGSPTGTPTPSLTLGSSASTTSTPTLSASPTATPTASLTAGASPSATSTATLTASPTPTPSPPLSLGSSPSTTSTGALTLGTGQSGASSATLGSPPTTASAISASFATLASTPTPPPTATLSLFASPSASAADALSASATPSLGSSPSCTPSPSATVISDASASAGLSSSSSSGSGGSSGSSGSSSSASALPSAGSGGGVGGSSGSGGGVGGAAQSSAAAAQFMPGGSTLFAVGAVAAAVVGLGGAAAWALLRRRRRLQQQQQQGRAAGRAPSAVFSRRAALGGSGASSKVAKGGRTFVLSNPLQAKRRAARE